MEGNARTGLRRNRRLSSGSAGRAVNVWRTSPERLSGGTRAARPDADFENAAIGGRNDMAAIGSKVSPAHREIDE
jgi:hypothetical protein